MRVGRVLRFLAGAGLFEEAAPRQFGLTSLGTGLRTDVLASMRPFALMLLDESHVAGLVQPAAQPADR